MNCINKHCDAWQYNNEGLKNIGEEFLAKMVDFIPLKRLGSVEDIAYAALFLS